MGSQSDIKVLFDLLAVSNNKNALLEIEIAKLKSEPKSTTDDLQKQLDLANKKILSLTDIHEKNAKNFASMKKKFEDELLKYKDSKNKIKQLKKNLFNNFSLIPHELLSHGEHIDEVNDIIENEDFDELLNYESFQLEIMDENFVMCNYNIFMHIIDNCLDINVWIDGGYEYLIFLVLYRCNLGKIKYLVDKKINLEVKNSKGNTPIYYVCKTSSFDVIDLILDQDVKLGFKNNKNMTQSDYINKNCDLDDEEKQALIKKIDFIIESRKTE